MTGAVAVTGGSGFLGGHVAEALHAAGRSVVNLTNHPHHGRSRSAPFLRTERLDLDAPTARLAHAMRGVDTLVNTYWVRFERGDASFDGAVERTGRLLAAARVAGVGHVIHVSAAGADRDAVQPYFRAKAAAEEVATSAAVEVSVVRPSIMFGDGDVLLNNIAWLLRRLPLFAIPGDGRYRLQPVFAGDVARLIVEAIDDPSPEPVVAAGPETYTFDELVRLVRWSVGSRAVVAHLPPRLAVAGAAAVGMVLRDVLMTTDEVSGWMGGRWAVAPHPACVTSLAWWLHAHRADLGRRYASELARHYRAA